MDDQSHSIWWGMDKEFNEARAKLIRDIAETADPFTKKRLLALADRYEPSVSQSRRHHSNA